jgi:hypothetical protein
VRLRPRDTDNYARILVGTAITYLRYGALLYHYGAEIPAEGAGSGEYGPFNHMFPITPSELGEGFVIGRERIVAAVSGTFAWNHANKPRVLVFDATGRRTRAESGVRKTDKGWSVDLNIEDWENIAVVE